MVTSITFTTVVTASILPPQAGEQLGGRPPFDGHTQDQPPQEHPHSRLNPELLKLIFSVIQNATTPQGLDFSVPNFFSHQIEQHSENQNQQNQNNQNPDKKSPPDEVDVLAKLILLHKAISFKIKNDVQSVRNHPGSPTTKKEEAQTKAENAKAQNAEAEATAKAVATLEEIEQKVELLIEACFAKPNVAKPRTVNKEAIQHAKKEDHKNESQLNHEGKKSSQQHKNNQEAKALLKELVKGEFQKNRAEFAKNAANIGAKNGAETSHKPFTAEKTIVQNKNSTEKFVTEKNVAEKTIKESAKVPQTTKIQDNAKIHRTEILDMRRPEKAAESAAKAPVAIPAPNPIPQKIISNIMVPYAAIEGVESANKKEKSKTQKKKKKDPKQKKRIFRKFLKKAFS